MDYRDGSLSSYPTSADDFEIVWPFGQDRILGTGAGRDDLEQAVHFNKLADGALNLEKAIQNRVAGHVRTYENRAAGGTLSTPSTLLLSTAFYTLPVSGTGLPWYEFTLDIPSQFGANPLYNWRFSITPTVYLSTGQAASSVRGVGQLADYEMSFVEPLNTYPHLCTMIMPVTGQATKYKLCIKALALSDQATSLSSNTFSDFQSVNARAMESQNLGPGWIQYGDDNAAAIAAYSNTDTAPGSLLALSSQGTILGASTRSVQGNYGVMYPAVFPATADHEIRFRPYKFFLAASETSGVSNRVGFYVRGSGNEVSPSFYCLTIGEQTTLAGSLPGTGFLYRVRNYDAFDTDVEYTSGILSTVTTSASFLGSCPLHFQSEPGSGNVLYSLRATGDVIDVRESVNNGSSWTTLLTFTDSSAQKLTSGVMGAVVFPLMCRGDLLNRTPTNSRITYFDRISGIVNSTGVLANFKVRTLFCLQGAPNGVGETESV